MSQGQVTASGSYQAECICGAEDRQQERRIVVVRNSTAYPTTLKKKTPVAQVVAATAVPEPLAGNDQLAGGGGGASQSASTLQWTVRQRQGRLFEELDLSGLESWPPELVDSAHIIPG